MTLENFDKRQTNCIRTHLICRIIATAEKKKKLLAHTGFVYFDEPVGTGSMYNVDRYGKGSVYLKDQLIPISWASLSGKTLMKMHEEIKANKVYVLKEYLQGCQGKQFLKTRLKNA